jgi:exodeoxyribonuclease VII small subunit
LRPDRPPATLTNVATKRSKDGVRAEEVVDLPFEKAMSRLSTIVEELESGQLSLEESLLRFEEGVGLARASQKKLDEAEAKVELLLQVSEDGTPITEEIEDA